jgi:V/A-type H+-transporting ATPase subunit F
MDFFVLGNEDVILGFQFVGINGKIVTGHSSALEEFDNAVNGEYGELGVLLISEKVSMMIEDRVMEWQLSGNYPLLVEIPDIDGHIEGKKSILKSIREAVGLHV